MYVTEKPHGHSIYNIALSHRSRPPRTYSTWHCIASVSLRRVIKVLCPCEFTDTNSN